MDWTLISCARTPCARHVLVPRFIEDCRASCACCNSLWLTVLVFVCLCLHDVYRMVVILTFAVRCLHNEHVTSCCVRANLETKLLKFCTKTDLQNKMI